MRNDVPIHSLLCQYHYELDSWSRLLSFQKGELVCCKNRLAEVVNDSVEGEIVLVAEEFQEAFLRQERIVQFLADELKQQKRILGEETRFPRTLYAEVLKGQKTLQREIKKGEEAFVLVKEKFEEFLHDRFGLES